MFEVLTLVRRTKSFSTVFVSGVLAIVFVSYPMNAMDTRQYDDMNSKDRADFIADLADGAVDLLNHQGKADQVKLLNSIFLTNGPGSNVSIFRQDFERNLAIVRTLNIKLEAEKDPRRADVEFAVAETFKKYGIDVTKNELLKIGTSSKHNPQGTPSTSK